MAKLVYVCGTCRHGFLYSEAEARTGVCRNCLNATLEYPKNPVILVCSKCHRYYDGRELERATYDTGDSLPKRQLGMLVCSRDETPLVVRAFEEEISSITDEIIQRFVEQKRHEEADEKAFLTKLDELRAEVTDITTKARPEEEVSKEVIRTQKIPDMIPIRDYQKLFSHIDVHNALLFWDFYYFNRNIVSPDKFPGDLNYTIQKIKGLLDEMNQYLLNLDLVDIAYPIIETVKNGKIYYIGDIHGSIEDVDKIIHYLVQEIKDAEAANKQIRIIFMGDYVDRSDMDIHSLLYIFAFALKYAKYVRLMRGNHEEVTVNMQYGLWNNINVYLPNSGLFNDIEYTFMKLPLVHMVKINGKDQPERCLVAVHGGIPFYPRDFSQMPQIPKLFEGGIILDSQYSTVDEMDLLSKQILWSDPVEELPPNTYFLPSRRGVGYEFGEEVFSQWMAENQVDRVVRSHEVFLTGHHEYFHGRMFSIFSASNYGSQEIDAVILEFDLTKPWDQNWTFLKVKDLLSI